MSQQATEEPNINSTQQRHATISTQTHTQPMSSSHSARFDMVIPRPKKQHNIYTDIDTQTSLNIGLYMQISNLLIQIRYRFFFGGLLLFSHVSTIYIHANNVSIAEYFLLLNLFSPGINMINKINKNDIREIG